MFACTVRQRRHQKNGLIVLAIVAVAGLIYFGYKHLGHPGSGRGTAEKQRQEKNKEWDKVYKDFEDPAPSPGAQPPVDPTVGQSNRLKKGAEAAAEAWKDAVEEAYIDPALGMGGVTPEVGVAVEAYRGFEQENRNVQTRKISTLGLFSPSLCNSGLILFFTLGHAGFAQR